MKKKYTKRQIEESIKYWTNQLNENLDVDYAAKDSVVSIIEKLEDVISWMHDQNENCTDKDRAIIENAFDWNETFAEISSLLIALAKSIGVKLKHFNY